MQTRFRQSARWTRRPTPALTVIRENAAINLYASKMRGDRSFIFTILCNSGGTGEAVTVIGDKDCSMQRNSYSAQERKSAQQENADRRSFHSKFSLRKIISQQGTFSTLLLKQERFIKKALH